MDELKYLDSVFLTNLLPPLYYNDPERLFCSVTSSMVTMQLTLLSTMKSNVREGRQAFYHGLSFKKHNAKVSGTELGLESM